MCGLQGGPSLLHKPVATGKSRVFAARDRHLYFVHVQLKVKSYLEANCAQECEDVLYCVTSVWRLFKGDIRSTVFKLP